MISKKHIIMDESMQTEVYDINMTHPYMVYCKL